MVLFNCNFVCCDTHTHNLYIDLYPVTLIIHHIKDYLEFLCIQIHFWVLCLGSRFLNHFFLWPDWTGRAFSTECWSEVGPCIYRVKYFIFKHDGLCRYLHQGSFWSFGHGFISSLPHPECRPSSPNKLLKGIRLLSWSFVSHITNIGNWLFLRFFFFFFASKETSFSRQLMDIDFLPSIVNSISNFWRYNLHLIDFLKPVWQASFSSIVVWNHFYYVWMHFHYFMFILLFLCSSPSLLLFDLSGSYILYYGILSTWSWPISTVLPKHYLKAF